MHSKHLESSTGITELASEWYCIMVVPNYVERLCPNSSVDVSSHCQAFTHCFLSAAWCCRRAEEGIHSVFRAQVPPFNATLALWS